MIIPTLLGEDEKEPDLLPTDIEIDWKAYYLEFERIHGPPVEHNGRLLFRDGWQYAIDFAGPEYPPPEHEGELNHLIVNYYQIRRSMVVRLHTNLRKSIDSITKLQAKYSQPLMQQVVSFRDNETGQIKVESVPIDVEAYKMRLGELLKDIEQCESEIINMGYDVIH